MKEKRHRTLGNNVVPSNYHLIFDTNLKSFVYSGRARIEVGIKEPTKIIKLNASNLKIKNARIISGSSMQIARHILNQKEETLWLLIDNSIVGRAIIEINFTGTNNDKMYGFYRSSYKHGGKENYILTTQFEAADARAAFPCFDEPEFKAIFNVELIVDNNLRAVSNMPVKSIRKGQDRKTVKFYTTPKMSTYLLYLGVGRYEELSSRLGKIRVNVLTTPGKKKLSRLSLGYAKKFILFYEKYFGVNYPLPKIDLLAIPDFAAGAMENWGAITFRETALLGSEKSPIAIKQRIAEVVAHELAHQWFGDLVTMRWWDDLWLNESFATFMSYKAMEAIFPEWSVRAQYLEDVIGTAFVADEVKSTHPVSVHVSTPEQISAIFDRISYEKGGTVLHMLEDYVGAEMFRQGLHNYLKSYKYGNATKYDLFNSIDGEVRKSNKTSQFAKIANYWVEGADYPVIDVVKRGNIFELKQNCFIISNAKGSKQIWPIPLRYISENDQRERFLLMDKRGALIRARHSNWIKLNYGQDYLYRVRYSSEMLARLGELIKEGKLSSIDAWGVENDLFVFIRTGSKAVEDYLDFVNNYCLEADYPLNFGIASHLAWLYGMLFGTQKFSALEEVATKYFRGVMKRVGWRTLPNERSTTTLFRDVAIRNLGMLNDKETIDRAATLFNCFIAGGKGIDLDIRSAVYFLAAWTGGKSTFNKLVALYKSETIPDEKIRLLQSLALFKTDRLVKMALDFSLSKEVKLQDSSIIPQFVTMNPIGKNGLWRWIRMNWKHLMERYAPGTNVLPRYISNLSDESSTKVRKEIERFFNDKQNMREDIKRALRETLERIDANINFMRKNSK